ncbi:hypothetical protein F5Y09DRAFT_321056 [Xylaria sp. FL1042]|nr:hypothetical protein F5Y09DRAFT_321056 [Xylaria sp. FL1042]
MVKSHSNSPKPEGSKHTTTAAASSSASTSFTPEMRDRQARGKNPYHSDSEDSDWVPGPENRSGGEGSGGSSNDSAQGNLGPARDGRYTTKGDDESFAVYDRRRVAAQILHNHELLVMAAVRDEQSIPATRLKYTRVLCGIGEPSRGPSRVKPTRPSLGEKQRKREQGQGQGGQRPE